MAMNLDDLIALLMGSKGQGQPQQPDPFRYGGAQGPLTPEGVNMPQTPDFGLGEPAPSRFGYDPDRSRLAPQPAASRYGPQAAQGPVTPPGVRTNPMYTPNQPQSIDDARAEAANAPAATPFNPLQNAVDNAAVPPTNPLQNAIDTAARPATTADLAAKIPPIQQSDLIPPITPGNTQGAMTPPITADNTDLGSMIAPITKDNTQKPLAQKIPPITKANTARPTPTPTPRPERKAAPRPARRPAPAPSPPRDKLAAALAPMMMGRAAEAGYTTSGTDPRYAGGSSAIFGRNRKK